jgi:hypothetical protein
MISARHHLAQKTTIKDRALLMGAAYIQDRSLLHGYVQDLLQQPRAAKHESVIAPVVETPSSTQPVIPVAEVVAEATPLVENVVVEAQVETLSVEVPVAAPHSAPVVAETPLVEPLVAALPVAELPVEANPVVEIPVDKVPVIESPVLASPAVASPAAELPTVAPTPAAETPLPAPTPRGINWFLNMRIKLRAQKYASLPQRIKASASTFEASKASAVATPVAAEAPAQQPIAEVPAQQAAMEAPAQSISAPPSSPAAQQQPVEVPSTQEAGYAIGAFSSFSFVEHDDDSADEHEENLVMLRESVELQAPVLPEDNGEIIFEEENRVVEIVVSPELLAKYFNGHLPAAQHHESAPVLETSPAEERMTLEFLPHNLATPEPRPPVTPVKRVTPSAQELIDRFIEQEPSIKRNAVQDIAPGDLARESSQERDDMVTETLAKIYAKQGNRGKAIKIYQKLGLLFPEKRDYFAARIAELK